MDVLVDEMEMFYEMTLLQFLNLPIKAIPKIIPVFNPWGITNTTFLELCNLSCLMRILIVTQATAAYAKLERPSTVLKKLGVGTNFTFSI